MLQMEQDVDLELLREREQALHQLEVSQCNRVRGQGQPNGVHEAP